VDVLHVLTCLAMFNLAEYRDRKKNPHGLFGHSKTVLEAFTNDLKKGNRVRSDRHKGHPAYFARWDDQRRLPARVALSHARRIPRQRLSGRWEQGKFKWMVEPDELLKAVIEEMATIVKQERPTTRRSTSRRKRGESGARSVTTLRRK
jgi:hypothetical protein